MVRPRKLAKSFEYAVSGIHYTFRSQQNARIHVVIGILVIVAGIFFNINPFEMGIVAVMILLVLVTEMVNTAIEQMVDLITKEHREEAKVAKDVASGMVLLTALGAVIVGILIYLPYIIRYFS